MKLLGLYYCARILRSFHASAADAAAVNPNGTKTLLANGLITLFIKGNPVLSNGPKSLPRNPPDCIIFDNSQPLNIGPQDVLRTSPSNVPRTSPKDPI